MTLSRGYSPLCAFRMISITAEYLLYGYNYLGGEDLRALLKDGVNPEYISAEPIGNIQPFY